MLTCNFIDLRGKRTLPEKSCFIFIYTEEGVKNLWCKLFPKETFVRNIERIYQGTLAKKHIWEELLTIIFQFSGKGLNFEVLNFHVLIRLCAKLQSYVPWSFCPFFSLLMVNTVEEMSFIQNKMFVFWWLAVKLN